MDLSTVESEAWELKLDHDNGIFTFESEKAAGVTGFLGEQQKFELTDISLKTDNTYISVGVVSMDEQPLSESGKVLVQTGTTYRPTGWEEEPAELIRENDTLRGYTILNTGRMPWVSAPTMVTLTIRNPKLTSAYLLDLAGYPVRELNVQRRGGAMKVELPRESLYVVLTE